jgi:predicted permease
MVVAAAGLLTRSLLRLQSVELGHAGNGLVFVQLSLPPGEYASIERHTRLLDELVARLEADGRISGATTVNALPFGASTGWDAPQFTAEGQDAARAASNPALNLEAVRPNYFDVFGIELVRGRPFAESDREDAPPVAIVSQDVAARVWPGLDPLGKRLKLGPPDSEDAWRTVVGVAAPVRYRDLADARATLYMPAQQFGVPVSTIVMRTPADAATAAAIARDATRAVDPDVAVLRVATFAELLDQPLSRPRFNALLLGIFAAAALLLAAVGLYAVVNAFVRQRTTEIGIRVALGASARDVRKLVLGEGIRLALVGTAIGIVGAIASARLLRGLLFEIHPLDPTTLLLAGALLVGVAAVACYLPARSAVHVDPIRTLRAD